MVKCNNPNCGFEKNEKIIQPCPKCGYVMHIIKKKKDKIIKETTNGDR